MSGRIRIVVGLLLLCSGWHSHARVFKFDSENLATYFSASGGDASGLAGKAFSDSSGANVTTDAAVPYMTGVEFGLITALQKVTLKIGLEVMQAPQVEVEGKNPSGTKLFDLTSSLSVFNPNIVFEYASEPMPQSKFYYFAGIGWATLTIDNAYIFTSDGLSHYAEISAGDYTEKIQSTFPSYSLGIGYEMLATDNVTFNMVLGYRYMEAATLTHKADLSEAVNYAGAVVAGDEVIDNSGDARSLSLSGAYISLGFRFYIDIQ